MGQQQLLLIVLGVIIVGISIVVGINLFGEQAAASNFDAVMNDMQRIAAVSQQWYLKPIALGGGGRSYASVSLASVNVSPGNQNGGYSISAPSQNNFTLTGVGVEDGDNDGTPVTISVIVYPDSASAPTITSR
ncbi:hypothetical protein ACFL40_02255 [candidate division KSB1 bacterium]